MWKKFTSHKITKFLASLKLAVIIIISLIVLSTWGTIVESRYNTTYAQWQVYFSTPFIIVEVLLFINILFAALVRFPYKKKLTGFYIIHAGLLILLFGAAVTSLYGIDGSIRLLPETPNKAVVIKEPTFYAFYQHSGSEPLEFAEPLPKTTRVYYKNGKIFKSILDYDVTLKKFLPFASPKFSWRTHPGEHPPTRFLGIQLKNANVAQDLELSNLDYDKRSQKLGPLTLNLFQPLDANCFKKHISDTSTKYLYSTKKGCRGIKKFAPSEKLKSEPFLKISLKDSDGKDLNFYPKLSSHPIDGNIQIDNKSQARLISLNKFRAAPHVLFFKGNKVGFGKGTDWQIKTFEPNKGLSLPWMGFEMTVLRIIDNKYQHIDWFFDPPRGSQANRHFAALISVQHRYNKDDHQEIWIDDTGLKTITTRSGFTLQFMIGNKLHQLPFELQLERFKMDTNPGTNDPASYESFVKVSSSEYKESAHVYMNNPLKKGKFTFYQASYFALEDGKGYGSVLSVNHDPGRALKYLGSFLLVIGSIIHFTLKSMKKRPKEGKA